MMAFLEEGVVIAHDPDQHRVIVATRDQGVAITISCRVGLDYADPLRIRQKPLPNLNTPGLILVPRGNWLNATWLTSYLPSALDAIHSTGDVLDPHLDYEAAFSGHWRLLDGLGQIAVQLADGGTFVVGKTTALPTINRHIVEGQQRTRVPFTRADRIPNPPPPFQMAFSGADGIGYASDGAGNATITATTLTFNVGGQTLKLDAEGLHYSGPILGAGVITAGAGGSDQVGLQTHQHPTAPTGAPSAPTAGT